MEYNKHQFKKTNDKKVLHKIGKQWKTVSITLLMALGSTAVATHVSHASANTNNNQTNNANQVTINQSNHHQTTLINTPKVIANSKNNTSKQANNVSSQNNVNSQNITQLASNLHKNIILSNINKQNKSSEAPVSSESKVNSSASSNVNKSASSVTNENNEVSSKVNNVSDQQNSNSNIIYSTYAGMNYKYNKKKNSVEFTSGTMKNNTKFHNYNFIDSNYSIHNVPNIISSASIIKFDSNINTDNVTDASDMFVGDNLRSLTLSNGFGKNIKYASEMFCSDHELQSLTLPDGFGKNITNARSMFYGDNNLRSLTLPNDFGQSIKNASCMFYGNNLQLIVLPNNFGKNITNADGMFYNDFNLKSLILPDGIGQNIKNASGMFYNNNNLQSLTLPKDFGKNISDASDMFADDTTLQSLTLPNNFGKKITIASGMFELATNLKSLYLPDKFGINVTEAHCMFYRDYSLWSLSLPNDFGQNISDAWSMFSDDTTLQSLILPNNFGKKITIASDMFSGDTELQLLTLPKGFGKDIDYDNDRAMFSSDVPLYLKDENDNYTSSKPMATVIPTVISDYKGTPVNPHDLAGTWVAKRNPKPAIINPYNSIYHDSYIANQDVNAIKADIDNGTKYADHATFDAIKSDGEHVASDQLNIEYDLSKNNMPALDDANQQVSLANNAVSNASSLYNDVKSVEAVKYSNIYSKSYDAYYDASEASNDANEDVIKNNASASAQVSNDATMINSARSAINTDYATYNVSNASTEDSMAQNALNNANTLYKSISNDNYSKIYNAYYNASYATSATNKLADDNNFTDNTSLSANIAKYTSVESSAMSAIVNNLSVDNNSAVSNANSEERVAHNTWTYINNIIYDANNQNRNAIYYVTYVDNNGNTVLHKAIHSLAMAKRFVPFGYLLNKIANISVVNGKHVMTMDVISEF